MTAGFALSVLATAGILLRGARAARRARPGGSRAGWPRRSRCRPPPSSPARRWWRRSPGRSAWWRSLPTCWSRRWSARRPCSGWPAGSSGWSGPGRPAGRHARRLVRRLDRRGGRAGRRTARRGRRLGHDRLVPGAARRGDRGGSLWAGRWCCARPLPGARAACCWSASWWRPPTPGWPPPGWVLAACDVGQGDALVLRAGPGSAVVVDAGPDPRLGRRLPAAARRRAVPLLVLTHFHADHVDGLAAC